MAAAPNEKIFRQLGDQAREVRMLKHMLYSCIAVEMMEKAMQYALRKQELEKAETAHLRPRL